MSLQGWLWGNTFAVVQFLRLYIRYLLWSLPHTFSGHWHEARLSFCERSLSLRDCQSNLDGRPSLNPIKPCLETGEFVNAFKPGELVTSNPITPP